MNRQQSDTAVLGALTFAPATGYAVRAGIRDVLGQFWSESVGQIYPTLTRLLAEGMVAASPGSRSGSSQYAITPAGRWRLGDARGTRGQARGKHIGTLNQASHAQALRS